MNTQGTMVDANSSSLIHGNSQPAHSTEAFHIAIHGMYANSVADGASTENDESEYTPMGDSSSPPLRRCMPTSTTHSIDMPSTTHLRSFSCECHDGDRRQRLTGRAASKSCTKPNG